MKTTKSLLLLAAVLAAWPASAASVSFSFTNGSHSATALFEKSGGNLVVTLTNTSTYDALVPVDILTGVYFNVVGDPLLTRISALVPVTSSVFEIGSGTDVTPGDRVVGGEWAYLNNLVDVPPNNSGLSSVGLGVFGPGDVFPGSNLQGPASPDGVQFGITSAGDNLTTGNGGISGSYLIKNAVVLTLGNFSGEPDAKIQGARFQYGTSLDEPQYDGLTPEPSTLALAGLGTVVLAVHAARRRRRIDG